MRRKATIPRDPTFEALRPLPSDLILKGGSHDSFKKGACLLEAVAWMAREPFGDHPACACPIIASFGRRLNDRMPNDEMRTELLLPLAPLIVGTLSTPAVEDERRWMAVDFAVREMTPHALCSAASMPDCKDPAILLAHAMTLQALPAVTRENWEATREACRGARDSAAAAGSHAYDAYNAYDADGADAYAAYAAGSAAGASAYAYAAAVAVAAAPFIATSGYAPAAREAARREVSALAANLIRRMCGVKA